jgi:hypothetical protein
VVTYKVKATLPGSRELSLKVPSEFPAGEVEVIIRAVGVHELVVQHQDVAGPRPTSEAFRRRFPKAGQLGPGAIKYDPSEPLSEDEWPEEHP